MDMSQSNKSLLSPIAFLQRHPQHLRFPQICKVQTPILQPSLHCLLFIVSSRMAHFRHGCLADSMVRLYLAQALRRFTIHRLPTTSWFTIGHHRLNPQSWSSRKTEMASSITEELPKFTAETLKLAAKQSQRCHVVPVRLRRAIKMYIRDQDVEHMRRKVLSLSQSFNEIKEVNLLLPTMSSKGLVEDPLKSMEQSERWKVKTAYGDIGLSYQEDQTIAYLAARMPAVYSALYQMHLSMCKEKSAKIYAS
ncbi:unnamed protein product [Fraxinus pennsylvanica]|uniref:Uncharacterized protein n=1 Tax=Fraxinus pennsylvanica TaxID=56036 RepID=A0AAD1ZTX6_9LAMI|nr:unnamed protein product [Fraxinus pennsylvanica]